MKTGFRTVAAMAGFLLTGVSLEANAQSIDTMESADQTQSRQMDQQMNQFRKRLGSAWNGDSGSMQQQENRNRWQKRQNMRNQSGGSQENVPAGGSAMGRGRRQ
jgi:outer membrane biogenesis lipoprotein LolB